MNKNFREKYEIQSVEDSIKFLESSNSLIKKEISQMKVLNNNSPNFTNEARQFNQKTNNIKMFYQNSRNMIQETLSYEKDNLDLGFDIDFKKELEKQLTK